MARGVEEASTYLLLVEWDAIEDHVAFTKTDKFARFGQAIGPHFGKPSEVLHFAPV